jgi:ubiquitin carboxyl-terminal hydrolase L3
MATQHPKHFIPLESNPEGFTQLIHDLGVSANLSFQDVLTLDEPGLFPRPALALILIFPTSETNETEKAENDAMYHEYTGTEEDQDVIWFKQTINNACGLYAILHAICNGEARTFIRKLDPISKKTS